MVPSYQRLVIPPNIDWRNIKSSNKVFDKLMSYRSYQFMITTGTESSRDTEDVRVHINNLNLTLKNHVFYGNHPIIFFAFLNRFVNEVNILNILKAKSFIALRTILADAVESKFRTSLSGVSPYAGKTCCLEAVQYLLSTYVTASDMCEALHNVNEYASIKKNNIGSTWTKL